MQCRDLLEELRTRPGVGDSDAVSIDSVGLIDDVTSGIDEIDTLGDDIITMSESARDRNRLEIPVQLENDCTAAALAEWVYGAGQTHDCIVHLMMGAGIGAGVIDHGHVFRGITGHAAEVASSRWPTDQGQFRHHGCLGSVLLGPRDRRLRRGVP
ncbi:ROK family protein [Halomontanus rarus]|uniref:ROK family protein n=1 Tax=Halomontanus rarus TaxID=3034020 RepID=UPI003CE55F7E